MSLNIKSQRTVALVRELAARTGTNQTAAVEDAVARRLSELDREDRARAEARRAAAEQTLRDLDKLLSDDDKRLIRRHEVDLYDDSGLAPVIVDTSAIVAIVSGESGAQVLKEALERSPNSRMSAPNYVELCAIMQRRDRPEISRLVDRLLDDYGIQVEAVDADQARVAAQAYRDYGRGSGHPARLNLGDTYSYALAQVTGEPLLFRGDDFTHTDIRPACT